MDITFPSEYKTEWVESTEEYEITSSDDSQFRKQTLKEILQYMGIRRRFDQFQS